MATETEVKFLHPELHGLRQRLQSLGAQCQGRVFERNLVLDSPDRRLRREGRLLRLRSDGRGLLTFKLPSEKRDGETFKVMEELESEVGDVRALERVFEHLGYLPALRYEKFRETWTLHGVHVLLDILPFGSYLEMEGEREAIAALCSRLGLDLAEASAATYHDLHQEFWRSRGLPPADDFEFTPDLRELLEAEAGNPSSLRWLDIFPRHV